MFFKVYRLLVGLKKRLEYLNYSCVCALNSWPIPCVLTIVEGAFLFEGQQQHGVHSLIRKKISLQQLFYITKLFAAGHFSDLFLTVGQKIKKKSRPKKLVE